MTTENKPLLAFHGDMKIKKKYLARVRAHRKADEIATNRTLGTRKVVPDPARKMGVEGQVEIVLRKDVVLDRGPKRVVVRASRRKPRRCYSTIAPICGRATFTRKIHEEAAP